MVKEKYTQLSLSRHFGGIRTMNIHRRCASCKKTAIWYISANFWIISSIWLLRKIVLFETI
jgi:hypothetical protein